MIDKQRLEEKCSTWNIALTGTQLDQLDAFAQILVDYNQKVNLTAITDPEGIEDKHFLDSLLFASQPEVAGRMVDVGAGAGFPGIVTKIFKPELELTLMEPTGKRVEFLKYACAQLGLTGVEFAKERAEEAARKVWREQFDLASARAVAALPMLAEYCLPLVKVGGNFLAMKGASGFFYLNNFYNFVNRDILKIFHLIRELVHDFYEHHRSNNLNLKKIFLMDSWNFAYFHLHQEHAQIKQ